MKKLFLLSFFSACFAFSSFGQTQFGVGATYIDDFGVQARANLDLGGSLGVIPSVSYYFTEFGTAMSADVNLTYALATLGDDMPIYGLAGLDLTRISFDGFSDSELGINAGGGIKLNANIYAEVFYRKFFCDGCGGEVGFNAGYYF